MEDGWITRGMRLGCTSTNGKKSKKADDVGRSLCTDGAGPTTKAKFAPGF